MTRGRFIRKWCAVLKQFVAQFWMQIVATALFAVSLARIWLDASWASHYPGIAVLLFAWVSVLAADELADWTGNYGWTRQQWHRRPEWFIRGAGLVALILVAARVWWPLTSP